MRIKLISTSSERFKKLDLYLFSDKRVLLLKQPYLIFLRQQSRFFFLFSAETFLVILAQHLFISFNRFHCGVFQSYFYFSVFFVHSIGRCKILNSSIEIFLFFSSTVLFLFSSRLFFIYIFIYIFKKPFIKFDYCVKFRDKNQNYSMA